MVFTLKDELMTVARKNLVDCDTAGFYHCTNRCVRRTFLCGIDELSGRNYEHRKTWIEQRMLSLCDIFAVEIYAYAVMGNHYHIVLYLDPKAPLSWSDEEVVERWMQVYPSRLDLPENTELRKMKKLALMNSPEKLKLFRQRLGSLSWYMRRLNEPLAKQSNQEECCSGRFWEDRFKSQALLDEGAVFSCMAYVDLNPVRAKITKKLEESNNTSIKARLNEIKSNQSELLNNIKPMITQQSSKVLNMKLKEYVELVEWTGQSIIHPNKASIPTHIQPILERLNLQPNNFLKQIENMGSNYYRAIGTIDKIRAKAKQLKVKYLRGVSAAKQLYIHPS